MDPNVPMTVTRTLMVDASVEEVWRQLTDDAELSRWFAGTATLDVVPGGVGRFADGDTLRRAVVQRVEPGRRLGFTWWSEADPSDASTVELVVDDGGDGRVQLTVSETIVPGGLGAGARACSWTDAADTWDGRLHALADLLTLRCSPLG